MRDHVNRQDTANVVFLMSLCWLTAFGACIQAEPPKVQWRELAPLPDPQGFAGTFAGVSHGTLIVAGGANFPEKPPWENGQKVWYDRIHVLKSPEEKWELSPTRLPRPIGYGVSVSFENAVLCIGGGDATRHYADVFLLRWRNGQVKIEEAPLLPKPCAFGCGALVGNVVYVSGGIETPNATKAMHDFWACDLSKPVPQRRWQTLPTWPGPERQLGIAASYDGAYYLFGGLQMKADAQGRPDRVFPYCQDAFRYQPAANGQPGQWTRLPELPRATAAAPSPALTWEGQGPLIPGGVDGSLATIEQSRHPGFKRETFFFDVKANRWQAGPPLPMGSSRVAAPTVWWQNGWAVISGESRPGIRSPQVFFATLNK